TEQITCSIAANVRDLERFPATKAVFLPDGYVPVRMAAGVGQRIVQKDLANTLRLIAKGGADVFYKGSIAKMIGEDFKKHGGIMTADDFAAFQPIINSGLKGKYRGYDIVTTAGPNGGVTFMQTLKILEGFDLKGMGHNSVEYCHVLAEAMRLAWTDRFCYVGDPDQVTFPEAGLVSEAYATVQRRRIRPDSVPTEAKPGDPWPHDPGKRGKPAGGGDPGGHDTTHLSAADTEGNFISLTQTLGSGFGSAVIPEGTGIMLYDVMMWMNPEPGTANSVGPWKRQLGHATPLIIMKDGRPWVSLGAPGGRRVVMAMVQCVINLIDFGMGIQEAIAAPRIFTEGSDPKVPSGKLVNLLEVDDRLSPEVMAGLRAKGHNVVPRHESVAYGHFARPLGVLWAEDGTLRGGVDIFRISTGIGV
ncbi:MAG: gamma-glutamyltransferase, partial [Chloroflexi bacterium]|nr:gamma-glutamyltransferase [Chloroflexota bacterium]